MAIAVPILVLILAFALAYQLSERKSTTRKYIVWGIIIMVAIAPFLSFLIGMTFGMIVSSGWAIGGITVILFPILFLVGLITLLMGIFQKKETEIT